MKTLTHPLVQILISTSMVSFLSWIPVYCYAQFLSTKALHANGYKSYTGQDWIYASVYLYAYIQRAPDEFLDTKYRVEVIKAYDFCVKQLNKQTQEYKKLVASQKNQHNDGIDSVTQGLDTRPPILRDPSQIPADAQLKAMFDNPATTPKPIIKKFN